MGIKMLIDFMITRLSRAFPFAAVVAASLSILVVGCQKVPLLAPSGSTITLTVAATALPVNGTAQVVAQVIEASGTPPHSGTEVTFTTSLGTIEPSTASTDTSGRAVVTFKAGNSNGTATITAISGGASVTGNNAIKIAIGTAAVGHVNVSASPATIPSIGGTSTIVANVVDINGNPLTNALVNFSASAGSLSQTAVNTDQSGVAQTQLTTSVQSTVTASVGGQGASSGSGAGTGTGTGTGATTPPANTSGQASGTVTVNVFAAPTLLITPPTTGLNQGLPATFTLAVTAATSNGSAVRDVTINFGDGTGTIDLGSISGSASVTHTYTTANTFTVTATLVDAAGNTQNVSSPVTVVATPLPTVIVTPTVPTGSKTATFQIQVTAPAGVGILDAVIDFGDNTPPSELGGLSGSVSLTHNYAVSGQYPVKVTVTDTLKRTTVGTTTAIIS
jgi:hypothetical protein